MTTSSGSAVQPVRARVKSTSSLQQPVVALHFAIPPPASVPSSRRSTSSLSSTPPTPAAVDTLMPACPTGWARFDLSPLNEVTVDTSSSAVRQTMASELPAQTSSDTEARTDNFQTGDFATFPSSSVHDDQVQDAVQSAVTEGQMSNDKFSDSFLAARDVTSFDDAVKQADSVVASSSFELMSPSSDKDSISLPSPEAPPPPLPANVLTTELPSEPPVPPPRPHTYANSGAGRGGEVSTLPITTISAKSDSVRSSPVQTPAAVALVADDSSVTKPPMTITDTSVISNPPSEHITTSATRSRFTVQPSSAQLSVNNGAQFPLALPSNDATPPPLPPRNFPVSTDLQRQQLMRGTSLPASRKIHSTEDVPPPPPPRRSLSKTVTGSQPVDPFAPIPVSVPVSSVLAKQPAAVAAATLSFSSNSSVVETTIAPLPRPRPHLRQTQTVSSEAASAAAVATSSGSSSPWQSVNTPPIIEPVDPFSNVDPFAGSVSPDDPFAEPSLDGMLSDLCYDFDTDTLSTTAFRTRAVTIDSVSSDVYDADAAASVSLHRQEAGAASNESHSSSHCNAANMSPVVSQTPTTEVVGTGCLVDLNTADDTGDAKWQPFSDKLTALSGSQAASGFALFGDLEDVWNSSGGVDWTSASTAVTSQSSDVIASVFDSPAISVADQPMDSTSTQVASDMQADISKLDTSAPVIRTCKPGACTGDASISSEVATHVQTSHCSLQSLSITSSTDQHSTTDLDDVASRSVRAVSEPPAPSQPVSSVERNNSSFDAVFGQFDDCFASWPAASAAANGTSVMNAADVAVSNGVCFTDLSTTSSVQLTQDNKQHNSNMTDLPPSDVQASHQLLVFTLNPLTHDLF